MKTIEFFKRKGCNPAVDTIGGEVLMDGKCVGEWNYAADMEIMFWGGDDSEHYGCKRFKSLEECAEWIAECGRYDHDYERYDGAMHYYFNTKTGYYHIANYLAWFPIIKKYAIEID